MNQTSTDIMTSLQDLTRRYTDVLRFGDTLFGEPVRGFTLAYNVKSRMMRGLKTSQAVGLDGLPPVRMFEEGRDGHSLQYGANDCRIVLGEREFRLLQFCNQVDHNLDFVFDEFWIVAARDYLAFYRSLRRLLKLQPTAQPPLMPPADLDRLWRNPIGVEMTPEVLRKMRV